MDKDRSPGSGGGNGLPPPPASSRYSPFPSSSNSFHAKFEPSSSSSTVLESGGKHFSHDLSRMTDFPQRSVGHRRAHSEILSLPDDLNFDSDLGVVGVPDGPSLSYETEEDFFSMYIDMEKFGSSSAISGSALPEASGGDAAATVQPPPGPLVENSVLGGDSERPRARHQHSQSMDGSTSIKSELLASGPEGPSLIETKKAMSAAKLADLALVDPKRAKRIWANRQSATRSKERKMRYIAELERKVQTLQTEATTLSAQLSMLQRDTTGLTTENSELKLRLQAMEQQVHLQDALNDALREEVQHLKLMTGQVIANGGQMLNYGASQYSANQQFYPHNRTMQMQSHLATQQFQQLHIHSQQQMHPNQHRQQQMHQHQVPQSSEMKTRSPPTSPNLNQQESSSNANSSVKKEL